MSGVKWYQVETAIIESDEFFELIALAEREDRPDAAWAAWGRLNALLSMIYRQGFHMRLTPGRKAHVAMNLGATTRELDELVGMCVEAGWFDRGLWESSAIVTSRGIQERWLKVFARRSLPKLDDEARACWLLDPALIDKKGGAAKADAMPTQKRGEWQQGDAQNAPDVAKNSKNGNTPLQKCALDEDEEEIKKRRDDDEEESVTRSRATRGHHRQDPIQSKFQGAPTQADPTAGAKRFPHCLRAIERPNTCYADVDGHFHDTPSEALHASLAARSGVDYPCPTRWGSYCQDVAQKVCGDCRASPEDCRRCYEAATDSLKKYERRRATSAAPLTAKFMNDARSGR